VHLGTRGCQAEKLLDFLRVHDADTFYLVGDIVDGWALRSSWYWPQPHNDVVQKLLRKARKRARIVYIPGNHDEFLRGYYGTHFGGIEVMENTIHISADNRRYLVVHGDIFDLVVTQARWLALLGDKAYEFITVNRAFNALRRVLGAPYWSLSQWAKLKVKNAVNYIGAFEKALASEARHHQADGVICVTSTMRPFTTTSAFVTSIAGTGWKAAPRPPSTTTAASRSSPGPIPGARPRLPKRRRRRRWHDLMKILVATDAWHPQVNGVVRTLGHVARETRALGVELTFLSPDAFLTLPLPSYPEIRLALPPPGAVERRLDTIRPDAIHIATEGPLGHAMRRVCIRRGLPFTTSFHTHFPDYVAARLPVPGRWSADLTWGWLRRFHAPGAAVLAATPTLAAELAARGFHRVKPWTRGVDANLFRPRSGPALDLPRPIFLTVGRVAVEKNLEAFLRLDLPGRAGARTIVAPVSRYGLPRCPARRGAGRDLRRRRRVRLSQPHSVLCCWKRWRAACRWPPFP